MVTSIHSLFDRATADRHMYDGGGVSSFNSHFANISDQYTNKYYVMRLFIGNVNVG